MSLTAYQTPAFFDCGTIYCSGCRSNSLILTGFGFDWVSLCLLLTSFPFYFTSAGKLVAYDTDGDGDFDVEDAKILLGKLTPA